MTTTTLTRTSGLNVNRLSETPTTDKNSTVQWIDFVSRKPLDDVDSFFAEFESDPEFKEGAKEAGKWLAEALYSDSKNLKALRLERGFTQTEFAKALGMKQPQVAKLENVEPSDPKLSTLLKLAEVLDVSLDVIANALNK